jgi:hypothetical protein
MPAPPSQRSIGGRGLCGCLRPSPLAKGTARASPPRFLQLSRHRFQSRLSCCRGSREEAFASPRLYWLSIARQFSRGRTSSGSFAIFAAIRRASSRLERLSLGDRSAKLLDERSGCLQIGKAPAIMRFTCSSYRTCTASVSRLNVPRVVKSHNPAAQSNV